MVCSAVKWYPSTISILGLSLYPPDTDVVLARIIVKCSIGKTLEVKLYLIWHVMVSSAYVEVVSF